VELVVRPPLVWEESQVTRWASFAVPRDIVKLFHPPRAERRMVDWRTRHDNDSRWVVVAGLDVAARHYMQECDADAAGASGICGREQIA
jgi:hypothetical protein